MAIIETSYKEGMSKEDAIALCVAAIEAGIYHDLGSGSNVDVCIITKSKYEFLRNYKHDNFKVFSKAGGFKYPKSKIEVLEEFVHKVKLVECEGE